MKVESRLQINVVLLVSHCKHACSIHIVTRRTLTENDADDVQLVTYEMLSANVNFTE